MLGNQSSTVKRIDTVNIEGDLYGDIRNAQGTIDEINVTGDIIGDSISNPLDISAKTGINSISAASMQNVRINSLDSGAGLTTLNVTGDVIWRPTSALALWEITTIGNWTIGGEFDVPLEFSAPLAATSTIDIGDDLGADADISLPSSGLLGNIWINTNSGSADWLGDITVGTTTLAPG